MTIRALAAEAKVDRDTLTGYEKGTKDARGSTVGRLVAALERLENEAGIDPAVAPATPLRQGFIEYRIEGGAVFVSGHVEDAEALEDAALRLARRMRAEDDAQGT